MKDRSTKQEVLLLRVFYILIITYWIDLPKLVVFITGYNSFYETRSLTLSSIKLADKWIHWIDLPELSLFTVGERSFYKTRSLTLSSILLRIILPLAIPFTIGRYSYNAYSFYRLATENIHYDLSNSIYSTSF